MRPRLAVLGAIPIRRIPWSKTFSTAPRISLAYDLHEPSKPSSNAPRPIIFMHGLFGSKKNNRSISKALARDLGRPVYAVDLRNHGDSPHNPTHDYMAMAGDVAGFIEEHQLKNTTLIGHSMGAKTAMTLALKAPDIIDNIVSVDNAPLDAALLSNFGKYIQGMRKIEDAGSLPIRQFLLGNLHRPPGEKTQKFKVPLKILGSALDNLGDFPFKDPGEVRFEKPALFVRGTQSHYVPDEALPIIGQFFPRFILADIDAGHWVISEKPEEFRQEFLRPQE
ncbi:Abhydrolase domain-containing protein [Lachnellula arida]|uniref:Abhydrolase domain-containing protein n=1 Tax=Lachnellula arida TaxID=1316785 RepID=A0A8T9BL64_9HELO|nr:Abhydrolase domain-containing protein [Lachnellula arida]